VSDGEISAPAPEDALRDILRNFWDSMEAIWETVDIVNDNANQLNDGEQAVQRIMHRYYPHLTGEQHSSLAKNSHEDFLKYVRESKAVTLKYIMDMKLDIQEAGVIDQATQVGSDFFAPKLYGILDEYEKLTGDPQGWNRYFLAYQKIGNRKGRENFIFTALLATTVGAFEVLVSQVIREFLELKPDTAKSSDDRFSLNDLDSFTSLEEFRKEYRDIFADKILFGGFDSWMKWFEKQQAITIEKLTPLPVVLEEIFQRRHLLVHNGGIVNRKYLEKLDNLSFPPALGEQLGVNYDYLIGAVECLSTTGVMIVCLVIKGLFPSSQVPSHFVQFATDEATLQKRYLLANQLCSMFLPHVSDEIIRKKLHYAILLAKKELFGLEVINDEVITLKNATSDELWKLLYLVLLDDFDEAAKLGNELL
jgi:hypothetical protein